MTLFFIKVVSVMMMQRSCLKRVRSEKGQIECSLLSFLIVLLFTFYGDLSSYVFFLFFCAPREKEGERYDNLLINESIYWAGGE